METILIVEDDADIRESLKEILELSGFQVSLANNGKQGYDSIMESCPDMVICDVNMPELDGFELLGAINQRLKDEVIPPFLFLTAKVEPQDIRQGMSLGADDYILKPFDHTLILEVVRMRLDKRKKLMQNGIVDIQHSSNRSFSKLALPSEEGLTLIPFEDIIRCEADRAYCTFHINNGQKILVSKAMKEFERILIEQDFIKVHKSTIVNINFAQKYLRGKGGQLLMTDGSIVFVSSRKKEELMKILRS